MESSSEKTKSDAVRIVQFTDCHLGCDRDFVLAGVNTYHSFSSVLSAILDNPIIPAFVAVTGDVASEGEPQSYQLFSSAMSNTPLHYGWLPGNHDDMAVMSSEMEQPFTRVVELGEWVALFLVSAVPGKVNGRLTDDELQMLAEQLQQFSHRPVLLFVHHPPCPVECQWLDEQRIANDQDLAALLASHNHQYKNIKGIFTGHVHQQRQTSWHGLQVYCSPSSCFQFTAGSETFALSDEPPGYRWIDLYPDGQLETGVVRLNYDMKKVDPDCIGY